jgi:hypothetical protein
MKLDALESAKQLKRAVQIKQSGRDNNEASKQLNVMGGEDRLQYQDLG